MTFSDVSQDVSDFFQSYLEDVLVLQNKIPYIFGLYCLTYVTMFFVACFLYRKLKYSFEEYLSLRTLFNDLFQLSYKYGINTQQRKDFFLRFKKILNKGLPFLDPEKIGSRTYIQYVCELEEEEREEKEEKEE